MKKITVLIIIALMMIMSFPCEVFAEDMTKNYTYQPLGEISFAFPEGAVLSKSASQPSGENVFSYIDDEFSTLTGSYAEIYYFVSSVFPDMSQEQLLKKYPREQIWTYCGLFDDTWANYDYVYAYLTDSVNSGSVVYNCEMEEITLDSTPFYKFTFKVSGEFENPPGGIIYLTLYKANQYTVQFCNFLDFAKSLEYAELFEKTVKVNGIEEYDFTVFSEDAADTTSYDIRVALMVFGAVCLLILIPAFIINTKGFNR